MKMYILMPETDTQTVTFLTNMGIIKWGPVPCMYVHYNSMTSALHRKGLGGKNNFREHLNRLTVRCSFLPELICSYITRFVSQTSAYYNVTIQQKCSTLIYQLSHFILYTPHVITE